MSGCPICLFDHGGRAVVGGCPHGSPSLALSVRQPWAWLIVHGYKPIENRNWSTSFRGTFAIHAAKGMTAEEYEACRAFVAKIAPQIRLPLIEEMERECGGIVGTAEIVDCLRASESPWFIGKWGFLMRSARPVPVVPCRGMPGFFKPELAR